MATTAANPNAWRTETPGHETNRAGNDDLQFAPTASTLANQKTEPAKAGSRSLFEKTLSGGRSPASPVSQN